ncbi:MAG: GntR family transcriptional regulator [Clostridiales bacterium]
MVKSKIDEFTEILKKRIEQGYYKVGFRLPPERELCEELGFSRNTVRTALLRLQGENILEIIPRNGTFIKNNYKSTIGPKIFSNVEPKITGSFIQDLKEKNIDVNFIEPSSIIKADDYLKEMLKVNGEIELLRCYRLQIIDKIPYRIIDSYYLASLFKELLGKDKHYIPFLNWLYENKGIYAKKTHERINIRMPSEKEAALLKISRMQPIVDMDKWTWSNTGILFQYTKIIFNASLHEYNYKYELDNP